MIFEFYFVIKFFSAYTTVKFLMVLPHMNPELRIVLKLHTTFITHLRHQIW